jgi:sensor histidine kinase YesM
VLIQLWVDLAAVSAGHQPEIVSGLVGSLVQMYACGLLTPALIYVVHRFPATGRPLAATLGVYVATVIGVTVVGLPLLAFVSNQFLDRHFTLKTTLQEGVFTCLVYAVVLTIIVAVTQVQIANERLARALRLEADLSRVRVEALQRQLHPHFIFNTLNAVSAIMHTDVDAAEEMIAALADLRGRRRTNRIARWCRCAKSCRCSTVTR